MMLEQHLYFVLVYGRWVERLPDIFRYVIPVPALLRPLVAFLIRRRMHGGLAFHGLGRHTSAEVHGFGHKDLAALATLLGDKPYMLGDQPSSVDATVFGILAGTLYGPFDVPERTWIRDDFPNLRAYVERMRARVWPDWDALCAAA
jgi:glutathione S-transferase